MSYTVQTVEREDVRSIARGARTAARRLAVIPDARRNEVLLAAATAIEERQAEILAANKLDCDAAAGDVAALKMSGTLFKRLQTSELGIEEMATRVRDVAALADPLDRQLAVTELDDDLTLYKVSCPLGVVGIVFEARPEVVSQIASLTLKSGNAVLLKGGAEARRTNETLVEIWRDVLHSFPDVPDEAINLLRTREDVTEMLALDADIDLIIPRGSAQFVQYVTEHSRIPVLGHGEGICHVYVDQNADVDKALDIAFDAKVQYPAVCNAMETLLVHLKVAEHFVPAITERFHGAGVEIRGCSRVAQIARAVEIIPATEDDWHTEYSDLIVSIKIVDSANEAIEHINHYGSKHTEAIVTEDRTAAAQFMNEVDAASVLQNASTRFADGFRYGFGAELGISTGKLHARGPVGLDGLTTYKYKLIGNGHTVASYSNGERYFKHRSVKVESSE